MIQDVSESLSSHSISLQSPPQTLGAALSELNARVRRWHLAAKGTEEGSIAPGKSWVNGGFHA